MSSVDTGRIIEKMVDRGIDKSLFKTLKYSGVDMEDWLHGFGDVTESVKMSVDAVRNHPLMDTKSSLSTGSLSIPILENWILS